MEIEFIIAPPPGFELAALQQIAPLRLAYARGRVETGRTGAEGYWFTRFGLARQGDWPAAPYRLPLEAAGAHFWLCADPVHLQVDRDQLLLDQAALGDLTAAEAAQLVAALNRHFEPDQLRFHAISPREWVLQAPRALDLAAPAPWRVAGQPAGRFLPRGADAAWARRITNEAQMLLHQSDAYALRESAGKAPVNSFWLWGGGTRTVAGAVPKASSIKVFSSVNHVREIADSVGVISALLPDSWPELAASENWLGMDKALIDLTEISARPDWPAILQTNWLIPAATAAKTRNMRFWCSLLAPYTSARARLYHRDLFHFFIRNPLARYVDSPQNPHN